MALLVEVVGALDAAHDELEELRNVEHVSLPDATLRELEQRDALAGTLKRVRAAFPGHGDELERIYREELGKAGGRSDDIPPMPVSDEVLREVAAVQEVLRRARLVDSGLDEALKPRVG